MEEGEPVVQLCASCLPVLIKKIKARGGPQGPNGLQKGVDKGNWCALKGEEFTPYFSQRIYSLLERSPAGSCTIPQKQNLTTAFT